MTDDLTDALPGMESIVPVSDDADMRDEKRFTAEVLLRDHPEKFRRICIDLFQAGESDAMVAMKEKVSRNTIKAIRDSVLMGGNDKTKIAAAAFFIKTRASNSRRLLQFRAIEALCERLENKGTLDDLTVEQLMSIADFCDEKEQGNDGTKTSGKRPADDVIDVESVDTFDAVINGLDGEKKRAQDDAAQVGQADHPEVGHDERSVGPAADDESVPRRTEIGSPLT